MQALKNFITLKKSSVFQERKLAILLIKPVSKVCCFIQIPEVKLQAVK